MEQLRTHDAVLWLDSDVVITNPFFKMETLALFGEFVCTSDVYGLNTGTFFARNSKGAVQLLYALMSEGNNLIQGHGWAEQEAVMRFATLPPYRDIIKVVPQRLMNSYWNPAYQRPVEWEDSHWQSGDFLLHMPALKLPERLLLAHMIIDTCSKPQSPEEQQTASYADAVKIDNSHLKIIHDLVCQYRPDRILEFGLGSGASCAAILAGIRDAGMRNPHYALVDNWKDFGGKKPDFETPAFVCRITQDEGDFVRSCLITGDVAYDFILSDADHEHTHEWFEAVYDKLLAPGGVLIYHDVSSADFPNLASIVDTCRRRRLDHCVYDDPVEGERTERGLLVIFKPALVPSL